ncbi:alpha/beta fold hydrolase [Abyssicoccus albus]|uniref:alpha/beta fold hydrolase n=1 Tax=Abyssicoccus albus TaxID=1817405 RepID=UPI00097E3A73|nr:alpha/beta hydrolase [Abyssicoccus albus]AQL56831.1 hypothetical protein BVH56_07855 [Abyssicoccus albus]
MYIGSNDVKLYYEDISEGYPIIFIHGLTVDHRVLKHSIEPIFEQHHELDQKFRRIYFDLPAMGRTKNDRHIKSTDDIVNVLITAIKEIIGHQKFIIVGQSYGGYISRAIIKRMHSQVTNAGFICPVIIADHSMRELPKKQVLERSENVYDDTVNEEDKQQFESEGVIITPRTLRRVAKDIWPGYRLRRKAHIQEIQQNYIFSQPLNDFIFEGVSLFLLGKEDHIVGYQDAINIADQFVYASYAILHRAGHNLQIEQVQAFNMHIQQWFNQIVKEQKI